jgi:beta-lactam-binding protein with PASTA domain
VSVLITIVALVGSAVLVAPVTAEASTHARRHMPNLVGLTRGQVYNVMRRDALYFVTTGPGSSNGTWREAVGQSPRAGTVVPWHFQATVRVSTANPHAARRVPRLIGLSRARTYAVLKHAQLFFRTRGPGSTSGKWIVVLRQSPRAGTRVRWHATITLVVSTKRPKKPVKKPVTTTTVKKPKPVCIPVPTTTSPTTTTVATTTIPGETTTTTTTPPPVTTSTICKVPVTTTTRPTKKKPVKYRVGDATWYRYIPNHCATWYLPRGTRITVRDLKTGKVIHCIASDREAAHGNRVVDLDSQQFAELAPLSQGVIVVKVSW